MTYDPTDDLTLSLMVQDSRVMGEETNTLLDGSADRLDMHEAYMKVRGLFWEFLDLKLGRMRVNYGEERLIGAVEWHNVGRSLDGGIFTIRNGWFDLDLFAFAQVESLEVGDRGDLNIYGFNWNIHRTSSHKLDIYTVGQIESPRNRLNRWTLGYYVDGKLGDFSYRSNGAYQTGEITPDSLVQDVSAYFLTLELWYRFAKTRWRPAVSAGIDYLSGDKDPDDGKFKVFDTLYATNHKFYGFMDYFLNIPADTFYRGLVDYYARFLLHIGSVQTRLDYHLFRSARDFQLAAGGSSHEFGWELDLTLKHKYNKNLSFVLGGSIFDPGNIFKEKKGSDLSNWGYIMLIADV